jgi:hypothetical protein
MMMSTMLVVVVSKLAVQEQKQDDECNSLSWFYRLHNERKNHDDECAFVDTVLKLGTQKKN